MKTDKNAPINKGIRTAIQSIVGSLIGLVLAVWAVPGVPEAVVNYLTDNFVPLLLLIGVPSGLVAFAQNKLGR